MTQFLKRYFKSKLKNNKIKEGSEAVGTALSTVFIMLLILIPIGLFVYLMPRITLEQDVQQFANSVRLDGYVSSDVYGQFAQKMNDRGYTWDELQINHTEDDWLRVYATDIPLTVEDESIQEGVDLIQTESNPNPPVVGRGEGKIAIQVVLPANSGIFTRAVNQLSTSDENSESHERIKETSRYYKVGREIMSEAYRIPGGNPDAE